MYVGNSLKQTEACIETFLFIFLPSMMVRKVSYLTLVDSSGDFWLQNSTGMLVPVFKHCTVPFVNPFF